MSSAPHWYDPVSPPETSGMDWRRMRTDAAAALAHRLRTTPQLSPREVAITVSAALPHPLGMWLLRRLEELGWLAPEAAVPFDILDGPGCPRPFRGGWREIVRLAVFGLPGQGLASRDKHRWDIYQQLCAEIMRGAVDTVSLRSIADRVLNRAEVNSDAVLGSMVRVFIAEREAALHAARVTPAEEHDREAHASKVQRGFAHGAPCDFPTRAEIVDRFKRLEHSLELDFAQFEESRALKTLNKMRELRARFPVHIRAADLQRYEEEYDLTLKRAATYRRQIADLTARAAEAARTGDLERSGWMLRRLEAIHALLPKLLPAEDLEAYRQQITRCGREHDTEQAARALRERKQAIVRKIKRLAHAVQHFHQLAERVPPEDEEYQRAAASYRQTVEEIRSLDTEWLTSLVLELETLLEDLDDPSGHQHNLLDEFIANVRNALNRLCLEIRSHRRGPSGRRGP